MNNIENFINELKNKKFINSLINNNIEVYLVGGCVRDLVLNKPNKDIDLLVRLVNIDELINHLRLFGKVDIVGKSFGVIKFKAKEDNTEYELALPRKEKPSGKGGHKGFIVNTDENLSIFDDLVRRDAKINAMAINLNDGQLYDPLGGLKDIENEEISAANPQAFSDDPLRMLRLIGFASRFDFKIEFETMRMIQENAFRINEIAPERILIEFDKIVKKGNPLIAATLLSQTNLLNHIFYDNLFYKFRFNKWNKVKTMGEFIYLLSLAGNVNPSDYFKNVLKGDINTYNEILALEIGAVTNTLSVGHNRIMANKMFLLSPQSLKSDLLTNCMKNACIDLLSDKYPKSLKELDINGNDLIQLGLKGKDIGDKLNFLLKSVYYNKVLNKKRKLLKLI